MNFVRSFILALIVAIGFLNAPAAHALRIDAASKTEYMNAVNSVSLEDMRTSIQKIWGHGLNPKTYWTDSMEQSYQAGRGADVKQVANQNFVRLLQDISMGAVDPEEMPNDVAMKSKGFMNAKQLQALVTSSGNQAELLIENLAPQSPPYMALKAALTRIYPACRYNQWPNLSVPKKNLKLGVSDASVVNLKKRFQLLGYRISSENEVVDAETVAAMNDVMWNMHVTPDGAMSPGGQLYKFLSVSCMDRVHQIQADMEKMRWFPQQFEDRFILVNLAFTYFIMIDRSNGQNVATSFRTINGRPERRTPTMKDKIVRVILNPAWIVPPTIFMEDKVSEIRGLPRSGIRNYFEQHNYEVWNRDLSKRLDPESIDWWGPASSLDQSIYIRQRPNYFGSLGVVKFELTNSMSIYLHDTNQRDLFVDPSRTISSGCIRLERPIDVAEYLLQGTEWTRSAIESTVAKPGEVLDKSTNIVLKNQMPVYLIFQTSTHTSDNIVRFTTDVYNQNQEILSRFNAAL
ncbi:MAG: L,D-transpeptidase family protein [Bdellovibrionaceae bacterium]|nr:L,D-transpeptidase family protein [Pseudobdellovibrionaceae bacterium]